MSAPSVTTGVGGRRVEEPLGVVLGNMGSLASVMEERLHRLIDRIQGARPAPAPETPTGRDSLPLLDRARMTRETLGRAADLLDQVERHLLAD